MKIEKREVPDLDSIPTNPQKAWEYGYDCAIHDIRLRLNLALSAARAALEDVGDCVKHLAKDKV